jgi:hypothetical protein
MQALPSSLKKTAQENRLFVGSSITSGRRIEMEKINWEKYRIRRCKSRYICKICGNLISKGEKYYNTGMKQAHTLCVEFLDYDDSDIDSKSNLEQKELFKKKFQAFHKTVLQWTARICPRV